MGDADKVVPDWLVVPCLPADGPAGAIRADFFVPRERTAIVRLLVAGSTFGEPVKTIVPLGLGAAMAMMILSPVIAQENDQNYGERSRYESGQDSWARGNEDRRSGWHHGRSMQRDRFDGETSASARIRIIRGNSRFDISCPANEQLRNCLELASKFIRDIAKNSDDATMDDRPALGMQEPESSTEKD